MLAFNFLKTITPTLYKVYLLRYITDNVIPLYEEYIRKEMRPVRIDIDQKEAIIAFCKIYIPDTVISLRDDEMDLNEIHPVFEYIKKHIISI